MVADLVTDEQVRAQCRIDAEQEDDPHSAWIELWIQIVSNAVAAWLKDDFRLYMPEVDSNGVMYDSNGDPIPSATINPLVQGACLYEIAVAFEHRTGEGNTAVPSADGWGYTLSKAATAILTPIRRPTVR